MPKQATLKVIDVVYETDDAVTLHFKQPLFSKLKYQSGQFVTLILKIEGEEYQRAYSISSSASIDKSLSITVKRVENGKVSNHIYNTIRPGDSIKMLRPRGNFILEPRIATERHIVLLGGGSGITPLLSIAKTVLYLEPQSKVSLLYCNMNRGSVIFNKKLESLQEEFSGRFAIKHLLEQPDDGAVGGRLEPSALPNLLSNFPRIHPRETTYYICGPEGMMLSAKEGLEQMGVFPDHIMMESFTGSTDLVDSTTEESFQDRSIKLKFKNEVHELLVKSNQSILDAALEKKIKIPFSCCSGACASCLGKAISGDVRMIGGHALSDKEVNKGYVLSCVAHPVTDDVFIEIE